MKSFPTSARSRRAARAAVAVVALVCTAGAGAADNAKSRPAPRKADAILTPAQLRECLAQQERKDKATGAALKTKAEIAAEKAAIDGSGTALADEATTLDRASEDAVNAYNAKVDERNRRIDAYENRVASYNKDADAVRAMSDAYTKSCGNRRYDDRDLADIQRKK
ncbi:MAG: hypothetical protein ACXWUL_00295 [Caldimonas sp.]